MTEDEAKTKRCCGASDCGERREVDRLRSERFCLASACMAWRWDLDGFDLDFDEAGPVRVRKTKLAHGHCGIAGRP